MKKWLLQLEIVENEDEFFQTLDHNNQHSVLKTFILDVLKANGFEPRIRMNRYEETFGEEEAFEAPTADPASAGNASLT